MFTAVRHFHYPDERPSRSKEEHEEEDGFFYDFETVVEGWHERKETGRTPDPDDVTRRIKRKPRWKHDLDLFDEMIEAARPKSPGEPAG